MLQIVLAKFTQHKDIGDILVNTVGALIEGNYHGDDYWGMIKDENGFWKGKNVLGSVLMLAREILITRRAKEEENKNGKQT